MFNDVKLHELTLRNPTRPVDWRWRRAIAIVEGRLRPLRSNTDEWTRRAAAFYKDLLGARTEHDYFILTQRHDKFYWAYKFFVDRNDDTTVNTVGYELEARLLAVDPFDPEPLTVYSRLADYFGCQTHDIEAYERLFFNVLEPQKPEEAKLHYRPYILHTAIGSRVYYGLQGRNFDVLWKLLGYIGGPVVLDVLVSYKSNFVKPTSLRDVATFLKEHTRSTIQQQAMMLSHTIDPNPQRYGVMELLNVFERMVEAERASGDQARQTPILAHLDALSTLIPFTVGRKSANMYPDREHVVDALPGLFRIDAAGVELTSDELIALATTGRVALPELPPADFPAPVIRNKPLGELDSDVNTNATLETITQP